MEQRSEEWFAARAGKITGSAFSDVMNILKGGESGVNRKNLIARLAVERITGVCADTFQNEAMRRGIELEAEACASYEAETGDFVEHVAFVNHPKHDFIGVSPDGLIGDDGLAEFKCPASMHKHLSALQTGDHAIEYKWQLQGQLWVTDRNWVKAVSYDPRFPEGLRLAIVHVNRDEKAIAELESECLKVNALINKALEEIQQLQHRKAA